MAVSNNVIRAINFVAILLSLPIIGTGIWLAMKEGNDCVKFLEWHVITLGVVILVVGLLCFLGDLWRVPWMRVVYLIFMLVLILLLMALVIFVFLMTNRGRGHSVPNRQYREYTLDYYSAWLRHRMENSARWDRIRNCLSSSPTCTSLNQRYTFAQDFFNASLTPLQSGCCKPPTLCGFTFVNPTYWISPINTGADMDCSLWNNNQTELCYSCNSCKAGLIANMKKEWRIADVVLLVTLIALICVYIIVCSAFRKAQADDPSDMQLLSQSSSTTLQSLNGRL